jgi:IS5 family transposase
LAKAIITASKITQIPVTDCYFDKGYRVHHDKGAVAVHLSGSSTRKLTRTQKRRCKRRTAVQPKIGHLKTDHRMGRSLLKGLSADAINTVLAAADSNLQLLLLLLLLRDCGVAVLVAVVSP